MADDRHYVPGSFYRIDDRTGFKTRAERTSKEWNGKIVRSQSWEPRHPQDFVRGIRDDQNVPEPRSRSPNIWVGNTPAFFVSIDQGSGKVFIVESSGGPDPYFTPSGGDANIEVIPLNGVNANDFASNGI